MKKLVIEARDSDKELLGTETIDEPENINDLHELFKDEEILEMVMRSYVIDVQRKLRSKARGPQKMSENEKAFRKLTPEQQAALIAQLSQLKQ